MDLPIEEKIDLKDALDKLVKHKRDALDVMIYMTLKWRLTGADIAGEIARLKTSRGKGKLIVVGN